jgi:hypothetical protein
MLLGRVDNQHRHVRIVVSEPSMFGNFRFAVRINCPVNWLHNDVRRARVLQRVTPALAQRTTGVDRLDPSRVTVGNAGLQRGDRTSRLTLIREPHERNVIFRGLRHADAALVRIGVTASPIFARSAGLIGDWPCLAVMIYLGPAHQTSPT